MLLLALLQAAVMPYLQVAGIVSQPLLLIALAWGQLRGINEGVLWAFIAGICLDLFSVGPLGATALAFVAAVMTVVWGSRLLPQGRVFIPILHAALATLIYLVTYTVYLRLLGYQAGGLAAATLPTVILVHAGLYLPVYWLMYAIDQIVRPKRVRI
jgi:rod shape-determining protein MreD